MTCSCNPPCSLQRIAKMTKAQLVESLINVSEERDMADAYYPTLERHLRERHGCTHDFAEVADA